LDMTIDRSLDLVRVDFAPTHRQPSPARLFLATLVSQVGWLVADAVLVVIGEAMSRGPYHDSELRPGRRDRAERRESHRSPPEGGTGTGEPFIPGRHPMAMSTTDRPTSSRALARPVRDSESTRLQSLTTD
jgi:hypothetical protein